MNTIEPAFPQMCADALDVGMVHTGMTLRDYFAAEAMQGWIATYGPSDQHPADRGFCGVVAEQAYALADAMLAVREAQP